MFGNLFRSLRSLKRIMIMKAKSKSKLHPDWWSKTLAGGLLSLSFAIGLGCIICLLFMHHLSYNLVAQVGMWSIPWIWMTMFFLAYFIPRGWQVCVYYSIANIVIYALLFWLRG